MTVDICGMLYEIKVVDDALESDTTGKIDYRNHVILISKNQCQQAKIETLCHEIVHGMLQHLGYAEQGEDEQFVQALGNAIYQSFVKGAEGSWAAL